jgi:hypothetical protein
MALKYLFKFEIKSKIYFELFIFCLGIINTWLFLADLPKQIHQQKTIDYPKVLLVFVKFILIPLTILYLVILYAYSLKILINWNLPKGWVSYLVIALSILGFLIHILINPIKKIAKSRLITRFYPWFYFALLPLIILLFVAVFKRISDYGITENRYLILVLSIWILAMTLYILFSKNKQLRYLPMTVAILSLLVSFGFWGMFSVSTKSQSKQFKELHTKMEATNFNITSADNQRFNSITRYLAKRKSLDKISDVLGYNPAIVFKEDYPWGISKKLNDTLGIKIIDYKKGSDKYKNYYSQRTELLDIKGYDYLKEITFYNMRRQSKILLNQEEQLYNFKLDTVSKTAIYIIKRKDSLHTIDLKPLIKLLEQEPNTNEINQEKLLITKEYNDLKIKILFHNLSLLNKKNNPTIIQNANATILLKEMQK